MKTLVIIMNRLVPIILAIVFLFIVSSGWAATYSVPCSGDITSALNSAIGSSVSGDTISIGAGTCSSSGVTVLNKQLTIKGAGQGVTNLTANSVPIFTIDRENASNGNWRITGMTITGSQTSGTIIMLWAAYGSSGVDDCWRIDHLTLNFSSLSGYGVNLYGPSWGLIDNCIISFGGGLLFNCQGPYVGEDGTISHLMGDHLLSLPLEPGSRHAVYIEDNTITCPSPSGCAAIDTSNTGHRFVVRHNSITNGMFYAHWTRGQVINGFWFEIYNNKVTWSGNEMYPVRFEAGTGVIYNNTFSGFADAYMVLDDRRGGGSETTSPLLACDGTHDWDGNAGDTSAPGWPCLGQIGRASGTTMAQIRAGTKPASFPFYSWNNGTQDKCYNPSASGSACDGAIGFISWTANYVKGTAHTVTGGGYGQGDIDFCSGGTTQPSGCGTHTLTYTPLQYPHPLNQPPPAPPRNLRITN